MIIINEAIKYREATLKDIPDLHSVRMAVKENILRNPSLVKESDYNAFLMSKGKGWLCEVGNSIVAFAIIDVEQNNIWALFVHPDFEQRGIGKKLHGIMLNWFYEQSADKLWLSTAPGTRAASFYNKAGWKEVGKMKNGELKFEMTLDDWKAQIQ